MRLAYCAAEGFQVWNLPPYKLYLVVWPLHLRGCIDVAIPKSAFRGSKRMNSQLGASKVAGRRFKARDVYFRDWTDRYSRNARSISLRKRTRLYVRTARCLT